LGASFGTTTTFMKELHEDNKNTVPTAISKINVILLVFIKANISLFCSIVMLFVINSTQESGHVSLE